MSLKPRPPSLSTLLRTSAPPTEFLLLRLALALDLFLDAARQLRLYNHIGRSRLAELFNVTSPPALSILGAAELAAALLLACGLLSRPAAAFALLIHALTACAEFARIGSFFSTPSALTSFVHATALSLIAACLISRGGGSLSLDAFLTTSRRPRARR